MTGGCHCGRIRFEVDGEPEQVLACNCSICTKKAYLHWIVSPDAFRLITPEADVATYRFNTGKAKHHFCPECGCAPFYIARSHPDNIDVNVRCLDDVDIAAFEPEPFDGKNWEHAAASYSDRSRR